MEAFRMNCFLAVCLCGFGCGRTEESTVAEPKSEATLDYERRLLDIEREERKLKAEIQKTENANALKQSEFNSRGDKGQ